MLPEYPNFLALLYFFIFFCTLYFTILRINSYGMGFSNGNCTAPFDILNADSSPLNASIPSAAG
jgi:hypothetical protein